MQQQTPFDCATAAAVTADREGPAVGGSEYGVCWIGKECAIAILNRSVTDSKSTHSSAVNLGGPFPLYCPSTNAPPRREKTIYRNPSSTGAKAVKGYVEQDHSPVQPLYLGDLVLVQVELFKTRQAEAFHLL